MFSRCFRYFEDHSSVVHFTPESEATKASLVLPHAGLNTPPTSQIIEPSTISLNIACLPRWAIQVATIRKLEENRRKLYKKTNGEFFAHYGNTGGEVKRERRAVNAAQRRDYHVLERRHDGVVHARDVAVAHFVKEAERRRSAETLAAEQNASTYTVKHLS